MMTTRTPQESETTRRQKTRENLHPTEAPPTQTCARRRYGNTPVTPTHDTHIIHTLPPCAHTHAPQVTPTNHTHETAPRLHPYTTTMHPILENETFRNSILPILFIQPPATSYAIRHNQLLTTWILKHYFKAQTTQKKSPTLHCSQPRVAQSYPSRMQ